MNKESEKYYLHPEEEHPMRTCRSKKFIVKVMFLAAVARPRFDCSRNKHFDGKIGIFPFAFKEPAKRNSKNRVAGTLETKPILLVTKELYRRCLIDNVLLQFVLNGHKVMLSALSSSNKIMQNHILIQWMLSS